MKAQALEGRTRMGFAESGRRWIDNRFRAAFVLLSHSFGKFGVTGRVDAFETRNGGSEVDAEYDDRGWSTMLAAKHDWAHVTGLIEFIHVSSKRENREDVGLNARQRQNQLQAEVRMHW